MTDMSPQLRAWLKLHEAMRLAPNYRVVTEHRETEGWDVRTPGDELELCAVHVDHVNKKIELEFA